MRLNAVFFNFLQSNNALKALFKDLESRYNIKYILTYRLNQDVLENFFGVIRAKGGLHDHPDQQVFKYRFRSYLLGRNTGVLSDSANVEVDDTPNLETGGKPLTGIILTNIKINDETVTQSDKVESEDIPNDGLENFAGYICHKLKDVVPNIAVPRDVEPLSYTWVDHLSEGGLSKPTQEMMSYAKQLDKIFIKMNGDNLLITKDFLKIHQEHSQHINCSEKIKKLFFRARMYLKIRNLNEQISEDLRSRKRKWHKTIN